MATIDVRGRLTTFVADQLLSPEQARELTPSTALAEWGVLNSLGMARLVGFIRADLGVAVPLRQLTAGNFRTLDDMVALITPLLPTP